MKKLVSLLLCLCLAFGTAFTLVSCTDVEDSSSGSDSSSSTGSEDTGSSSGGDSSSEAETLVSGVGLPASIVEYMSNCGEREDKDIEFFEKNRAYVVGDDNAFRFKPEVSFINEDLEPVIPESWSYSYKLELKNEDGTYGAAAENYLDSADTENCLFDFSESAVGNSFRLSVTPNGLTAAQQGNPRFIASFEFDVIDGYNAYTEEELGYISNYSEIRTTGDAYKNQKAWEDFRKENGLNLKADEIRAVIMHNDMNVTADKVPSAFFYSKDEVSSLADGKWLEGSLKDETWSGIYFRIVSVEKDFTFEGNYFTLDASQMPYIYKMAPSYTTNITFDSEGNVVESNVISHATLLRVEGFHADGINAEQTYAKMQNINVIGNSPKTEDKRVQGGFIMLKTEKTNFVADNLISKCCFITTMGQVKASVLFKNLKCFDAFNSPIYNWGCEDFNLDNCVVRNAGGPAIIADAYMSGSTPISPRIVATNCEFDNPVEGTEAWFVMGLGASGAAVMVPQVKAANQIPLGISKQLQAAGMPVPTRSFLMSKDLGDNKEHQMFNVYCICKDGGDEVGTRMKPYIEINGAVMDYGTGAVEGDKCNGKDAAVYRATLAGALLNIGRGMGAPILETSGGGIVATDGKGVIQIGSNDTDKMTNLSNMMYGDMFNMYYYTASQMGMLGIMFEYYTL